MTGLFIAFVIFFALYVVISGFAVYWSHKDAKLKARAVWNLAVQIHRLTDLMGGNGDKGGTKQKRGEAADDH